jgi:hypothetical protein
MLALLGEGVHHSQMKVLPMRLINPPNIPLNMLKVWLMVVNLLPLKENEGDQNTGYYKIGKNIIIKHILTGLIEISFIS